MFVDSADVFPYTDPNDQIPWTEDDPGGHQQDCGHQSIVLHGEMKYGSEEDEHKGWYPWANNPIVYVCIGHLSIKTGIPYGKVSFKGDHDQTEDHHKEEGIVYVHLHLPRFEVHDQVVESETKMYHLQVNNEFDWVFLPEFVVRDEEDDGGHVGSHCGHHDGQVDIVDDPFEVS